MHRVSKYQFLKNPKPISNPTAILIDLFHYSAVVFILLAFMDPITKYGNIQ